jgi:hypothetical protein
MEAVTAALAFVSVKASTIVAAAIMAGLGFMLDSRKHSWPMAALAITAGMAVAIILTDPISDYFHLADTWHNAVAGALGIGGRNMIITISKLSRDPGLLMRIWRGERDE